MCYEDNDKFDRQKFYNAFMQEIDNLDKTENESDRSLHILDIHYKEVLAPLNRIIGS